MPVVFTYDFNNSTANKNDRTRINLSFKRFGWESIGGSALRYPEFTSSYITEDWMNHVIPALMFFRSYVTQKDIIVTRYSLDIQSSSGYKGSGGIGNPIFSGDNAALPLYNPPLAAKTQRILSENRLRTWLTTCEEGLQAQ
jgi:hypothetical protein